MGRPILGILLLSLMACDLPPEFRASPAVMAPSPTTPTPPGPVITSLSPSSVTAGSSEIRITIKGSGFVKPSETSRLKWNYVVWNGQLLDTEPVSASRLRATVPARLLKNPGTARVWVIIEGTQLDGYDDTPPPDAITFTITE